MDHTFHYLVMAEQTMLQKELLARLKGTGLTIGQPKILDYLLTHDGASQKDIARGCHIEPGTLTSLLNRMEESSLVVRRMLNGNRRSSFVFMTDKGKELAALTAKFFSELEDCAFHGISTEEQTLFMDIFFRICQNTAQLQCRSDTAHPNRH